MYISPNAAGTRQGACNYTFVKCKNSLVSAFIILTYALTKSNNSIFTMFCVVKLHINISTDLFAVKFLIL